MIKDKGWICLHRKLRDNPRYNDPGWSMVWIELLLSASHKDRPVVFGGERIMLQAGQLICGRKMISSRTGVNESKVQRVLKIMQDEGQIEQQMSGANRLITIVNWKTYQEIKKRADNGCTSNEQPVNTNNNTNDGDNEKTLSEEDAVYHLLIKCSKLHLMTYGQYVKVRQEFETMDYALPWLQIAQKTVDEAGLLTESIHNPALFWRRQIQKYVEQSGQNKIHDVNQRSASDRIRDAFA